MTWPKMKEKSAHAKMIKNKLRTWHRKSHQRGEGKLYVRRIDKPYSTSFYLYCISTHITHLRPILLLKIPKVFARCLEIFCKFTLVNRHVAIKLFDLATNFWFLNRHSLANIFFFSHDILTKIVFFRIPVMKLAFFRDHLIK